MKPLLLVAGIALLLVGGCSATSTPHATPTADRFGAPEPTRSLDVTTYASQPCRVLSEDQLRDLEVEPAGRLDPLPTGAQACVWRDSDFTREISVALYANRDFLVDAYRSRGTYQRFESTTIVGLPAVVQQSTAGGLSCTITTGIAVGQAVDVTASEFGATPAPSCDTALRLSEAVVSNLPPPGGR